MGYLSNALGDANNLGFFSTEAALTAAYPVGAPGYFAIVGTTGTIWIWDGGAWIDSGAAGASAYVYIAYASNDAGANFTNTFDPLLDYIAIKTTTVQIPSPVVGDFTGLWKNYKGAPGTNGTSFTWRGTYNAGTAYVVNDNVYYNGTSYINIQAGTGQTPDPAGTAYWSVLALKGTNGAGAGDVNGPVSSVSGNFSSFSDTTGKNIADSGSKASDFATALGANDNYVTDAQLVVIGNTSGTNTGDSATNSTSNTYADAKVADAINNGTTTIAPSQNVVFDALALKADLASAALTGTPTAPTAGAGTSTTQLATTEFVQVAVRSSPGKEASNYATTAALPTVVYNNGTAGVGATLTGVAMGAIGIDSGSPAVGQRVLVKNQVSTFENGIYDVTATGSGIAVFVLTRSLDFNATGDIKTGASTYVVSGTVLSATTWDVNSADSPVMGTDAITFIQSAGPGSVVAGNGIAITGTSIAINTTVVPVKTDNLSVFAATTSAQLAGVISDETGSGALVFATSPTLVTPALGTPASGIMTNVTGLPAAQLSGAIPSAVTATTQTANDNSTKIATTAYVDEKVSGWNLITGSWTYSSVDGPTGVITVPTDATTAYSVGMRIRLTQTTVKYFIITAVTATTLTVYGGTDYTLANAAISLISFSLMKIPFGFPLNPDKWTVEISNTDNVASGTLAAGTWFNTDSISISIPIGLWNVSYGGALQMYNNGTTQGSMEMNTTLSTTNNGASDNNFTTQFSWLGNTASITSWIVTPFREKVLSITSKTTYYLNEAYGNGTYQIYVRGDLATIKIRARCAYL